MLNLQWDLGFSLVAVSSGYSLVAVCQLLIAVVSLAAEHRLWGAWASVVAAHGFSRCGPELWSTGPGVEAHGLSCSVARGIFLDQCWNRCHLHWQAGCLPLATQEALSCSFDPRRSSASTGWVLCEHFSTCRFFDVFVGGGELCVLLFCHLDLSQKILNIAPCAI